MVHYLLSTTGMFILLAVFLPNKAIKLASLGMACWGAMAIFNNLNILAKIGIAINVR